MKIAIYGKSFSENNTPYISRFLDKIVKSGAEISVYKPFMEFLGEKIKGLTGISLYASCDEIKGAADLLFSIGGDGTLLDTLTLVRDSGIPIAVINTGRLGFLSGISKENAADAVDDIIKGNYSLDKRTLLHLDTEGKLFGEVNYALNELTIQKKDSNSMITTQVFMNGDYLNSYWADGLIIATPTGSTAYSLSCGGPIITPDSGNFIIAPVAPHNLNVRPIVIPDTNTLTLKVKGRNRKFLVSLDSRSETVDTSVEFKVRKENFTINLLRLTNQNYLYTLRNKLMWGLDKRN